MAASGKNNSCSVSCPAAGYCSELLHSGATKGNSKPLLLRNVAPSTYPLPTPPVILHILLLAQKCITPREWRRSSGLTGSPPPFTECDLVIQFVLMTERTEVCGGSQLFSVAAYTILLHYCTQFSYRVKVQTSTCTLCLMIFA